ncbi:MAG: DNA polymerase III subunit delta [Candidatus Portnoybacteria bacterium]|nr:DNA polymerase III subunit delta [Candidatus Portnoybacteria bacterium]
MVIFLYGPDSFRASQKLKEIKESYKAKHKSGLNFRQFDWQPENLNDLKEAISSVSMFAEKKLVVIKNACRTVGQGELLDLLEKRGAAKSDDLIMVFFEAELPQKSELAAWLLKKAGLKEEFIVFSGIKLNNWVKNEIEKNKGKITAGALQKFLGCVGDLWQAQNEISKLLQFKKNGVIEEKDVDLLVRAKLDPNIFTTIDALALRNKSLAFRLLHQHLAEGESEVYILSMFVYQFRNLILIKSLVENGQAGQALAKKTGLHPFVVKKSLQQVKNFSPEILKKIYGRLLNLDIALKRGRIEPKAALDLIVAEIAS